MMQVLCVISTSFKECDRLEKSPCETVNLLHHSLYCNSHVELHSFCSAN